VPRRVQHLGDQAVGWLQVPHGISQNGPGTLFLGKLRHAGGAMRAARRVEMVNDLDDDLAAEVAPPAEGMPREVRAAGGNGLANIAGGAQQEDEASGMPGDQLGRDRGGSAGGMGRGNQAA